MQEIQHHVKLPVGRTAKLVFEIDAIRSECSEAARKLLSQTEVDGVEFEECAKLDDALAKAHAYLKAHLRQLMLARISRRSRRTRA